MLAGTSEHSIDPLLAEINKVDQQCISELEKHSKILTSFLSCFQFDKPQDIPACFPGNKKIERLAESAHMYYLILNGTFRILLHGLTELRHEVVRMAARPDNNNEILALYRSDKIKKIQRVGKRKPGLEEALKILQSELMSLELQLKNLTQDQIINKHEIEKCNAEMKKREEYLKRINKIFTEIHLLPAAAKLLITFYEVAENVQKTSQALLKHENDLIALTALLQTVPKQKVTQAPLRSEDDFADLATQLERKLQIGKDRHSGIFPNAQVTYPDELVFEDETPAPPVTPNFSAATVKTIVKKPEEQLPKQVNLTAKKHL